MVRECWAYLQYEDGSSRVIRAKRKDGIPFEPEDMERWLLDRWRNRRFKPVVEVRCRRSRLKLELFRLCRRLL